MNSPNVMQLRPLFLCLVFLLALQPRALAAQAAVSVSLPPDSFFALVPEKYRTRAREFYKKYLLVGGLPVVAAAEVEDEALTRTSSIVQHMLAGRPDILEAMVKSGMYLIIIGKDQLYTDMPEYSDHPNPTFQNERVRGTGGKPTSFGEENVLSLPLDRYDDESIAVHEFCHTIDGTLRGLDPSWTERRNSVFRQSIANGLWQNTYAASNPGEFWAEVAQSYFDCNRVNNWNHGPIGTREQLKVYDSAAYELVHSTFKLTPATDWRYTPRQRLPNVSQVPEKFKADPFYTKFSAAREFPIFARSATDEAVLRANQMIRSMFAYRGDILKALIHDGVKLVVLGKSEKLSELPELKAASEPSLLRFHEYNSNSKLLVVDERNLLVNPGIPLAGDNQLIYVFAKAIFEVCAHRPVDPNWEKRGREVQQYELRVTRLDVRFKEQLTALLENAKAKNLWRGSVTLTSPADYWARGLLAYFNAAGQVHAPQGALHPISTREALREYDLDLHNLVANTMAFEGKVDWRAH